MGYMLDTINYHSIRIREDNITVLTHDFYNKLLFAQISHLIEVLDREFHDTFKARLADIYDPAISDMLTKQHTEIRSCHRILLRHRQQIDQRQTCICR